MYNLFAHFGRGWVGNVVSQAKREAKMMHKFWPIYWTFGLQRMQCMICNVIFQEDSDANHDVAPTWTSIRTTYSVRSWAPVCGLDWQVNSNGFCTQFCPAAGWSGTIANDSGARATPWDAMRLQTENIPSQTSIKSSNHELMRPYATEKPWQNRLQVFLQIVLDPDETMLSERCRETVEYVVLNAI